MGIFHIHASNLGWICGPEDDPNDLCLHGHVTVQIGQTLLEDDGTVSATALLLLKTLTEDKISSPHDIQMIPCCGHFLMANEDGTQVEIIGCDNGTDWTTLHQEGKIKIILKDGQEEWIDPDQYRQEVFRFADEMEHYYRSCQPKILPEDEFDRRGYEAFWNEWHRRRGK
jgi:hypothetical protein